MQPTKRTTDMELMVSGQRMWWRGSESRQVDGRVRPTSEFNDITLDGRRTSYHYAMTMLHEAGLSFKDGHERRL
jgi:hypothetical protein